MVGDKDELQDDVVVVGDAAVANVDDVVVIAVASVVFVVGVVVVVVEDQFLSIEEENIAVEAPD